MSPPPHRPPCHSVHHIKAGQTPESGSQGRGPCGLEAGAGVWVSCPVLRTQLPVNLSSENTPTRFMAPGPASHQESLDSAALRPPWPFNCCPWPGHLDGQSACCDRSPERSPTLRTQALLVGSREVSTCALSPRLSCGGRGRARPHPRPHPRPGLGEGTGLLGLSPAPPPPGWFPGVPGRRGGGTAVQKFPRLRLQNAMSDET